MFHPGWTNDVLLTRNGFSIKKLHRAFPCQGQYSSSHVFAQAVGRLHPRSLTWPLKNHGWNTRFLWGWYIFRGYVQLPGSIALTTKGWIWSVGNAEGWRGLLLNAPLSRDFVEECGIWGAHGHNLETKPVGHVVIICIIYIWGFPKIVVPPNHQF